jgi:hypothetical protein
MGSDFVILLFPYFSFEALRYILFQLRELLSEPGDSEGEKAYWGREWVQRNRITPKIIGNTPQRVARKLSDHKKTNSQYLNT